MKFKYIFAIFICVLLNVAYVGAVLLAPVFVGNAIDLIIGKANVDFNGVFTNVIKLLICVPTAAICQYTAHLIANGLTIKYVDSVRCRAYKAVSRLSLANLDKINHGDLIMRISLDAQRLTDGINQTLTLLLPGILTIIGTLIFMFSLNAKIAILVALLTPFSIVFAFFIAKYGQKMLSRQVKAESELSALSEEYISNLRLIRLNNYEKTAQEKFSPINNEIRKYGARAVFIAAIINPGARLINGFVYTAVCLLGAFLITKGQTALSIGTLSIFLSYALSYAKPFNEITSVVSEMQAALVSGKRLFSTVKMPQEPIDIKLPSLNPLKANIKFKNAGFSYGDTPFINNLNLEILSGQSTAVVGQTGSGKTTLISLIMRFYELNEGKIEIDGTDISTVNRASLRHNIGMVLQDTWIFKGTIKENIAYALDGATDTQIINAAKRARIDGFITSLENGYNTIIEPQSISQGQAQLISLARIFLNLPKIIILDEATSSIDARTELKIQQAFKELTKGHTCFIVAHRLNTIKNSDLIIVMQNGRIAEKGTHTTLLNQKGLYYNMLNTATN